LNITGNATILSEIIKEMPFLEWIHSITAGVDHIMCPAISENDEIVLTNAKGVFSCSLAEYVMTACSYFAKNIPRMLTQQKEKKWEKFCVTELKEKTMGIVGYGEIQTIAFTCFLLERLFI
jgi:phosphoglycerate dehydrogenase-like enzyme